MSRFPAYPTVRILVLGDSGAGKTSLLHALTGTSTGTAPLSTVGCAPITVLHALPVRGHPPIAVFVEFFDIGGHRKYSASRTMWYRECHGVMLVFDLRNVRSYQHLAQWADEYGQANESADWGGVPTLCVGTKSDLVKPRNDREFDSARDLRVSELIQTNNRTVTFAAIDAFLERAYQYSTSMRDYDYSHNHTNGSNGVNSKSLLSFDSPSPHHRRSRQSSLATNRTASDHPSEYDTDGEDEGADSVLTINIDEIDQLSLAANQAQLQSFSQSSRRSLPSSMFGRLLSSASKAR